jgi:hypothetical protein
MARPRSVLSEKVPRATKPKPAPVVAVQRWRSRPTLPGPFGDDEQPFEGDEAAVRARHEADTLAGMAPVLEVHSAADWTRHRDVPTMRELAHQGLAHEVASNIFKATPAGQARIYEAMRAP